MKIVLVVGWDWKFRALLRAQLREEGYEALAFETLQDAEAQRADAAALVFDTTDSRPAEWQPLLQQLATSLPVVVVVGTEELMDVAPARVLRRPVRLADIISVVREVTSARP